ncbi:hypothetical protein I4F81_011753 [Pyropia yezoensis]|uniref:Uncharacterized protein n=1 Tax=Pyropia yezoensis TaxID=2788 RepID=A0ACC3CH72_PYRYE|nr:hypothetical protein I4F81_011753 [Neopyropia yezoensis]
MARLKHSSTSEQQPRRASVRTRAPPGRTQPVARAPPPLAVQGPAMPAATSSASFASVNASAILPPPRRSPPGPAMRGALSGRGAWRRLPRPSTRAAALVAAAVDQGPDAAAAARPAAAAVRPPAAAAHPPAAAAHPPAAVAHPPAAAAHPPAAAAHPPAAAAHPPAVAAHPSTHINSRCGRHS